MLSRSSWLHLRIPFSYFLMPVYFFALGISPNLDLKEIIWTFLIIHLLLYPASNGFNSYFDKDEKSIGGLKNPPQVTRGLYYLSLLFDLIAIVLGWILISLPFAFLLFIYGLVSKMYSHPLIRLKKYAIGGWLITGLFQGLFTFSMCYIGINKFGIENIMEPRVLLAGGLTSLMLWGSYPMTQVYQHEEDAKHHDKTMSMLLGIKGTFIFVQLVFGLASIGFFYFFSTFYSIQFSYAFLVFMIPILLFFSHWFYQVLKDESKADFSNTMKLNFISATCLNGFFIYFYLTSSHLFA
jgi:1,4-dihydroxy-2-naphthoate octaprenyltransferase